MQLPEKLSVNQKVMGQKQSQQQVPVIQQPNNVHGGGMISTRSALNGAPQVPFSYTMAMHSGLPPEHYGGHLVSPTQGPMQLMPAQMQHPILSASQEMPIVASQPMPPNASHTLLQYPSGLSPHQAQNANQPTTPPIGLNLHLPSLLQAQAQHQGIFSPPSTTMTHSPQILGHSLGTSLFSPPPSSSAQHGAMFVNSPTSTGKVVGFAPGTPAHPPVGSGTRFRRYESPKLGGHISEVSNSIPPNSQPSGPLVQNHNSPVMQHKGFGKPSTNGAGPITGSSGFQPIQLPPRLAQQQQQQNQQRNPGTRYQNQRHPANRGGGGEGGKVVSGTMTLADHLPTPFVPMGGGALSAKREALLPTPPSTHMVKLDTTLTCEFRRQTSVLPCLQ